MSEPTDGESTPAKEPDPLTLGEQVVAAQLFLYEIHRQTQVLVESLDGQLAQAEQSWTTIRRNICDNRDIGPQLDCERWLLWWLFRFYFPDEAEGASDRLIGLVIYMDPLEGIHGTHLPGIRGTIRFAANTKRDTLRLGGH